MDSCSLPGTDTALLLGIAYWIISNNLQDQNFLDSLLHLVFDANHMPKKADPNGNFKDYVLGTFDGCMPKTPAWASSICGVSESRIKTLWIRNGNNEAYDYAVKSGAFTN